MIIILIWLRQCKPSVEKRLDTRDHLEGNKDQLLFRFENRDFDMSKNLEFYEIWTKMFDGPRTINDHVERCQRVITERIMLPKVNLDHF